MKNLISMTDFVLEQYSKKIIGYDEFCTYVVNYANFLKQLLELWMFVPCKLVDGVWVVLEEPNILDYQIEDSYGRILWKNSRCEKELNLSIKEYQQAKERCLFKGFWISAKDDKHRIYIVRNNPNSWNIKFGFKDNGDLLTIEDLVKYNPTLTKTAQKQISI